MAVKVADALRRLRRRKKFLDTRIAERSKVDGPLALSDYDVMESAALHVAISCVLLCRTYAIVAISNKGEPLLKGQMGEVPSGD